ncbi:MAG TPA: hypothetical protein VGJ28_18970 [Micromonosporaceae bacterium]|jgi:hypothetical protein
MAMTPEKRSRRNRFNGTTACGHLLARLTRCRRRPGPLGTTIAEHYRLRVPAAAHFVIGDVVFCHGSAYALLVRPRLLVHELRHTYQYARWGPLFFPVYFASSAWSFLVTGSFGARNVFEVGAGLADGGYRDAPVRPIFRAFSRS